MNRRRFWAAVFVGGWTLLGVLSAIESYIGQLVWDKPITWGLAFRRSFKEIGTYAVLSLGVLWLCRRMPLLPGRGLRWFAVHLAASIVFAIAHLAIVSVLLAGERSVQTGEVLTFSYLFGKMAVHYTASNIMKYWIFVLGCLGWRYYRAYRERELQTARLQQELVEARLSALRMQLNPHFLFNTLHAVSALITENPEAADRVVVRLSELLRLSLDPSKPQEVPLGEELSFLDRYLDIEKTRFAERLQVSTQIEPETRQALVPFLILQPLVENAIRHGIEPREEHGQLTISARRANGRLELVVRDNGAGLPGKEGDPIVEGIGLSNTRSRLRHLYGEKAQLQLIPANGGGLEARVALPFRTLAAPCL